MKTLKKIGKWTGIVIGSILALVIIVYAYIYFQTEHMINKKYAYTIPAMTIPTDSLSIARGEHLYHIRACVDCHGPDLNGKVYVNDPMLLRLTIPNITKGKGGLPADFDVKDWLRVLRHGVDKEGRSLFIMPSHESSQLSKGDLADLIAYCMSRPPVASNYEMLHEIGPIGRVVLALNKATVLPAEKIDHNTDIREKRASGVSTSYGKYLAVTCQGCHRQNLQGGGPLAPGYPDVPNITSTGEPGKWNDELFIKTIRTGQTPEGKKLRNQYMPWKSMNNFSDEELKAIFVYLKSLPEKQ